MTGSPDFSEVVVALAFALGAVALAMALARARGRAVAEGFGAPAWTLVPPDRLSVGQGVQLPMGAGGMAPMPQDELARAAPTVDGSRDGPRALFALAYNRCGPACCGEGSGLSCAHGCICLTPAQRGMVQAAAALPPDLEGASP